MDVPRSAPSTPARGDAGGMDSAEGEFMAVYADRSNQDPAFDGVPARVHAGPPDARHTSVLPGPAPEPRAQTPPSAPAPTTHDDPLPSANAEADAVSTTSPALSWNNGSTVTSPSLAVEGSASIIEQLQGNGAVLPRAALLVRWGRGARCGSVHRVAWRVALPAGICATSPY